MTIKEKVQSLSSKEFASLAVIIGFVPRYYKKFFEYEFNDHRVKEEYKHSYEEFKINKKKLDSLGLTRRVFPLREEVRSAWIEVLGIPHALPSQVHMWAKNYTLKLDS